MVEKAHKRSPQSVFLDYQTTDRLYSEGLSLLKKLNKTSHPGISDTEKALECYRQLLRLKDHAYPLLLQEGHHLALDGDPSHLYLLPPVGGTPKWSECERLVLCQNTDTANRITRFRLLRWRYTQSDVNCKLEDPFDAAILNDVALSEATAEIQTIELNKTLLLFLFFENGRLQLTVDSSEGVTSLHWAEGVKSKYMRVERCSHGNMEPMLSWARHTDSNWRNDNVVLTDESLTPLISSNDALGHIHGADGKNGFAYVGGNMAKVWRIPLKPKEPSTRNISSSPFGGTIQDVLIISFGEKRESYSILAAASDGRIYMLSDKSGKSGKLEIVHYQTTHQNMVRLVGDGGEHILARDQQNNLIPLRIYEPEKLNNLLVELTDKLFEITGLAKVSHPLWEGDGNTSIDDRSYCRLILEHYLQHQLMPDQTECNHSYDLWAKRLLLTYNDADVDELDDIALLHNQLLERIWNWMDTSLGPSNKLNRIQNFFQNYPDRLEALWILTTPPQHAPDWFWLHFFRNSNWLSLWASTLGLTKENHCRKHVEKVDLTVKAMRRRMMPVTNSLRSLTVRGGGRFPNHIRHLRACKDDIAAFVDLGKGIRLIKGTKVQGHGSDKLVHWHEWKTIPVEVGKGKECWEGLPTSLWAGDDVAGLCRKHRDEIPLIVATNNGEIRCFTCLEEVPQSFVKRIVELDIRCGVILDQQGMLLGGRDPNGVGALHLQKFNAHGHPTKQSVILWRGNEIACIRKLVYVRKNERYRVWGLEREQGRLLYWEFPKSVLDWESPAQVKPECWLNIPGHLHTLSVGNDHVLVGGSDGVAYSLDLDTGALCWMAGCGGSLRRSVFLRASDLGDQGYWLVGGDHRDVLLIDEHGQTVGVAEHFGPVTTIVPAAEEGCAYLGELDGRLTKLGVGSKFHDSLKVPAVPTGPFFEGPIYPLRNESGLRECSTQSLFKRFSPEDSGLEDTIGKLESLPALSIANELLKRELHGVPKSLGTKQLAEKIANQQPSRLVALINIINRAGGEYESDNKSFFDDLLLSVIEIYWNNICAEESEEILCQPLAHILGFLESILLEDTHDEYERARISIEPILNCIWGRSALGDGISSVVKSRCPKALRNEQRVNKVRMGQVLRVWSRESGKHAGWQQLREWLMNLQRLWGIDDPEVLKERLLLVLSKDFPLLPINERKWSDWLLALVESRAHEPPEAFSYLLPNSLLPWLSKYEEENLKTIDDEANPLAELRALLDTDTRWLNWLARTNEILQKLQEANEASPHLAWRERDELFHLSSQISNIGREQFSLEYGYPIFSIWWPNLSIHWANLIEQRLQALQDRIIADESQYIDQIALPKVRWISADRAQVTVTIRNRGTSELRPESITWMETSYDTKTLPQFIPTSTDGVLLTTPVLKCDRNTLKGILRLTLLDSRTGVVRERSFHIEESRTLLEFNNESKWDRTWKHLESLVEAYKKGELNSLIWINGRSIGKTEYLRLRASLKDLYDINVEEKFGITSRLDERLLESSDLIFSPDLALGAEPSLVLEQLHELLHPGSSLEINWLAFNLWVGVHEIPQSIYHAFQDKLVSKVELNQLFERLLGQKLRDNLYSEIKRLPKRAIGAFCFGEPIYSDSSYQMTNLKNSEKYSSPAVLFTADIWQRLDGASIESQDLADWLGFDDINFFASHYKTRETINRYWESFSDEAFHETAKVLANVLGGSALSQKPRSNNYRHCKVNGFSVLHRRYSRCYFLPPNETLTGASANQLQEGVWLCLGSRIPPELPGLAFGVELDDVLCLIHAGSYVETRQQLNRIAAVKCGIQPRRVFRTDKGMTSEQLEYHFTGRDRELERLEEALVQIDDDDRVAGVAALIIGARRMGKTTLRQKLELKIDRKEMRSRPVLKLDLQDFDRSDRKNAIEHEFYFFKRLQASVLSENYFIPESAIWKSEDRDRKAFRDRVHDWFENFLDNLKREYGGAALLAIDETEGFAQRESMHDYPILRRLRRLSHENKLCLLLTSYPHGLGHYSALNQLRIDSSSAAYNCFDLQIVLDRWSPEISWEYLYEKLRGFGIIMPLSLRSRVLSLTQGVPWIIHRVGLDVALGLAGNNARRLVLPHYWRGIEKEIRRELHKSLKETVNKVAMVNDRGLGFSSANRPERQLGQNRLWQAMKTLAKEKYVKPVHSDVIAGKWLDEVDFQVEELLFRLDDSVSIDRLSDTLNSLTSSDVIVGDPNIEGKFYFCNNLLPLLSDYEE